MEFHYIDEVTPFSEEDFAKISKQLKNLHGLQPSLSLAHASLTSDIHTEMHVSRIRVRHPSDYPNSPLDINKPLNQQNWWDITMKVLVQDGDVIDVTVEEIRKWKPSDTPG